MRPIKVERLKQMPVLKQEIIRYLFKHVSRKNYDVWHKYKGNFWFEGKEYNLECEVKFNNTMFTYRKLFIEHKQEIIDIEDMIKAGYIDA